LLFDFAILCGFGTAITAIVLAAAVVVIVVTVAIAFVFRSSTTPFADVRIGVFALAFFAVLRFNFAALYGSSTTITTIVLAATVIVIVVTIAIPFVFRCAATPAAGRLGFRIQALAILAVFFHN